MSICHLSIMSFPPWEMTYPLAREAPRQNGLVPENVPNPGLFFVKCSMGDSKTGNVNYSLGHPQLMVAKSSMNATTYMVTMDTYMFNVTMHMVMTEMHMSIANIHMAMTKIYKFIANMPMSTYGLFRSFLFALSLPSDTDSGSGSKRSIK